jgi:hypothetical protein
MDVTCEIAKRIRLKKARYCRYMDTKQWGEFEKLALPDAKLTFFDVDGTILSDGGIVFAFNSPGDFVRTMARFFEHAHTSHSVSNLEIELISDMEMFAIWAMQDHLVFRPIADVLPLSMHGYGHYHEIWQQRDGDWFLRNLELKRTIRELSPAARLLTGVRDLLRR